MPTDDKKNDLHKLEQLVTKSNRIIYQLKTVFPFDLFPSEIIIDETKITLKERIFFYSEQVFPITYDNLNSVVVEAGVLFATMKFEISGYNENPSPMKYFWIHDARKARRIILGLIQCFKEKIDLSKFDIETVRIKAEEIGAAGALS